MPFVWTLWGRRSWPSRQEGWLVRVCRGGGFISTNTGDRPHATLDPKMGQLVKRPYYTL